MYEGGTLTLGGAGTLADRNVGNKTSGFGIGTLALVNGSGVAANYIIDPLTGMGYGVTGPQASLYSITTKNVTLNAAQLSKAYDGTTAATAPGGYLTTLSTALGVAGDTVSTASLSFTNKNVGSGNRTVNLSGVTVSDGNGGANYSLTLAANTTSTITQAAIGFTTSAVTKTYDGGTSASGTVSLATGQLFGSDSFSGGNTAFANKDVARDGSGDRKSVV